MGRLNVVKMFILPKEIYRFSAISIKIPMAFFAEVGKKILKLNLIGPSIAKTILKKKSKFRGLALPDFKTYYKAIVIKTTGTGKETDVETNGTE